VTHALAGLDIRPGQIRKSAALGLALVSKLDDAEVEAAVDRLTHDPAIGQELNRFRGEREQAHPGTLAPLDLLIKGIRLQFAQRFPGWEVTIGKNYGPSLVKGHPHVGGGGDGDPRPTAEAVLPPHVGGGSGEEPQPADAGPGEPVSGQDRPRQRGGGVRVGLLDTRIFPNKSLTGHYIAGPDDVLDPDKRRFTMFDGHCAFVASCILQRAPAAELHVRHVLNSQGIGWAWDVAVAIAEMAKSGLDVVNLSLGEFLTDDDNAPMVLETAVKHFSQDTVVVAAAGNNGDAKELTRELVREGVKPNSASYPAALPDVVGVGALDQDGKRAAFTPAPAPWIALLAPGVGLTGAYVDGDVTIQHKNKHGQVTSSKSVRFDGTATWEGCSFAAGIVSGELAARTVPGRRSARQALAELLRAEPGKARGDIVPNTQDG
jgi:membrane-anchored mycosin MYCP